MSKIITYNETPLAIELIAETFETSFQQKFDADYWRWRFQQNPFSKKIYIAYILEDDLLAAYYAVSPITLTDGKTEYKFALSNMTMTHPAHQGKGYFKLISQKIVEELKKDGFDGIVGFANNNSHHGFKKYLGWCDLSVLMLFQLDIESSVEADSAEINFNDCVLSNELIETISSFNSLANSQFSFSRSAKFIKWRLLTIPNKKYRAILQTQNNNILAITVYKAFGREIDVMEHFEHLPITKTEKLRIKYGIGFLRNKYKGIINIWSNVHSKEHLILEKMGFKETTFSTNFGIIPFTEKSRHLLNYENWHYRFLDSDVF